MTINEAIELRAQVKEDLARVEAEKKALTKQKEELDYQLITLLDAQGLSRTANDKASVSINEDTVPEVKDWDLLYAYIGETGDFSVLQRRPTKAACEEKWKLGETVPGVEPRSIRRINFRTL
jgi:hypothetical protein